MLKREIIKENKELKQKIHDLEDENRSLTKKLAAITLECLDKIKADKKK